MVNEPQDTETTDQPATVKVTGPGVSIERGVNERTMNAVIGLLVGAPAFPPGVGHQEGRGAGGSSVVHDDGGGAGGPGRDVRKTLGEFLDDSGAKTFSQKICATGFYLTAIEGADDFNRDEVKSALLAAREDMPGNYSRDWLSAINMRLIAPESRDASRFYIPRTGQNAIESKFQDAPKPRRGRKSTRKASYNGGTE